jgi:hypothetical protein
MSENNQLTIKEQPQPSVALMLQTICERGITAENTEAMTQLMKLHERMEDRQAERDFNAAFAALQAETPDIVATSVIPNRGKYERFEDVMHVMRPLLSKHGFSVSFSQETGDRITVTCHLRHASGHSQQTKFGVRLGGKADSETQADCKASTTAKRNSLLQALNIVIRQDCMQDEDDARITGEVVSAEQAASLFARVEAVGADKAAFLSYAGAKTFSEISASRYDALDAMLARKEKAKA